MKKTLVILCLFIFTACNDPYELTQSAFESIYDDNQQMSYYFNQAGTIVFICKKEKTAYNAKDKNLCKGKRRYIKMANLSYKLKNKITKKLKKELLNVPKKLMIQDLIKKVSELTGKLVLVHPDVKGLVVDVHSKNQLDVLSEFSLIMSANGYTLTERKGILLVEPSR